MLATTSALHALATLTSVATLAKLSALSAVALAVVAVIAPCARLGVLATVANQLVVQVAIPVYTEVLWSPSFCLCYHIALHVKHLLLS